MEHVLSLSYGKDSIASIEACYRLGYPIDRVIHVEVWATDTISADLPPMLDFKSHVDDVIKKRYGLSVEHITATDNSGKKITYESYFYKLRQKGNRKGQIMGFPFLIGPWCNSRLKLSVISKYLNNNQCIQILGIASDETNRINRFLKE